MKFNKCSYVVMGISCLFVQLVSANDLLSTSEKVTQNNQVELTFNFSDKITTPPNFVTQSPSNIVVDFVNVKDKLTTDQIKLNKGAVNHVNVVGDDQRTRAVISLNQILTQKDYTVTTGADGKSITVAINTVQKPELHAGLRMKSAPLATKMRYHVLGFDFRRGDNGSGKFVVKLSSPNVNVNVSEKGDTVTANFLQTSAMPKLQRLFNVTDFATPVETVLLTQQGNNTNVALAIKGTYRQFTYQLGQDFIIEVAPITATEQNTKTAAYKGDRISLNFQDIKVRAVLQLLADFTGLNIVTSDSVNGSITLRLKDVPWDQAFDIILKSQGLAQRRFGSVVMVAPSSEVTEREKSELQADQQVANLAPVTSELIQVNYAKAKDLAALIKGGSGNATGGLLSDRGTVSVDERTNNLWVQDTSAKLNTIKDFVHKLDMPIRQVIIKARIVNVDSNYTKDLGIRFGLTRSPGGSGTLEGANRLRTLPSASSSPAVIADETSGVPLANRLAVDLPSPGVGKAGGAGSFGIALANIGSGVLLDLELSALETEGGGEIISSPTLVTSNQQQATIEQGVEIPYEQATSSGATSVAFKKAVLSLDVTPQITPDDRLILTLKVNQDSQGQLVGSIPAIDTRQVQTQVLVNNGDTIVLGGVYTQNKLKTLQRIPFLGSLPVIGNLFKNTHVENKRSELLIFITPKIVQQKINEG